MFNERLSDQRLLVPAVEAHLSRLSRVPRLVAADAGFYSQANEAAIQAMGFAVHVHSKSEYMKRITMPVTEKALVQKWQKWRAGCEGRISTMKQRHLLARCQYHGIECLRKRVGLSVMADNLINTGKSLAPVPAERDTAPRVVLARKLADSRHHALPAEDYRFGPCPIALQLGAPGTFQR